MARRQPRKAVSKIVLAGVLVLGFVNQAKADLTFAEWAKGPADGRAIYTAGVMDTVGVYAEALGFLDRWKKCLADQRMSVGEIGEGALAFSKRRPIMNSQPAPAVFIAFMNERCELSIKSPLEH